MNKYNICTIIVILIFSAFFWGSISGEFITQERISKFAAGIDTRLPDSNGHYHIDFEPHGATDDEAANAEIWGANCGSLVGEISDPSGEHVRYRGSLFCVPYVENIEDYLNNSMAYIGSNEVSFENGPRLVPAQMHTGSEIRKSEIRQRDEEILRTNLDASGLNPELHGLKWIPESNGYNGAFLKVQSVGRCGKDSEALCARTIDYSYMPPHEKMYYILCWECEKLSSSATAFGDAIQFSYSGNLALDGGVALKTTIVRQEAARIRRLIRAKDSHSPP